MSKCIAIYARVSSEKQAQSGTILSQIDALEKRVLADGHHLLDEHRFIDNGYSGSNLVRPALEQLRDKVYFGEVEKVYIHSPDRLSRKYAYQIIILEEFNKNGVEIIFLNCQINDNPESQLLLQMQGMIAEYERAKIIERYRRGKIHAAKRGLVNVLTGAPYGYRYINKINGGGNAVLEINIEESKIIHKIFDWVGKERLSIREVCSRLNYICPSTRKGNRYWNRSTIFGILENPTYKGLAAYGKTKTGKRIQTIRTRKNSSSQPRRNSSIYKVDKEHWINIPVPAIVDVNLFDTIQEQLKENKNLARTITQGTRYLLQGLLVCGLCHHAFCGKPMGSYKKNGEKQNYIYYRCSGKDSARYGGSNICESRQILEKSLDTCVWEEVKNILKNPKRVLEEFQKRIDNIDNSPLERLSISLDSQKNKLTRGISRLIDSYTQEYINKEEFEQKIKGMKKQQEEINIQINELVSQQEMSSQLKLIITNLEDFFSNIKNNLETIDWVTKRAIIRMVVKRIEINSEDVNIVYRINELPKPEEGDQNIMQHCGRGEKTRLGSEGQNGLIIF